MGDVVKKALSCDVSVSVALLMMGTAVHAGDVSNIPLIVSKVEKSNVLVILDNSNSMDEDASGAAVGSQSSLSKSEIARNVIKTIVNDYTGRINMGLMAYQQNEPTNMFLHNSPYDVSYYGSNYKENFEGARDSQDKRYRIPNPTDPGNYVYYNVALPFYSSVQSTAFCFSNTAKAFNNGEVPPTLGPWDTYRCYGSKTGQLDNLPNMDGSDAALYGYASYLYSFWIYPTDSDLAQGITDFGRFTMWYPVSRTWFRNDSPGRGYLHVPIKALDSTHAGKIKDKLACNVPAGNPVAASPATCSANGIKNAGLTPIEGTFLTAKDYFGGSWTTASEGYLASGNDASYPLPNSCNKNYAVLLTDGLPSNDKNGNALSDPAAAIQASANAAGVLKTAGVESYVVGFALPYGTDPKTLKQIAEAGGTSQSYTAGDAASLKSVFSTIFADILQKEGNSSSVATNSTRYQTNSQLFQAIFNSKDWSGSIRAFAISKYGVVNATASWETIGAASHFKNEADRKIYSYDPSSASANKGIEFKWGSLNSLQHTTLGDEHVVSYLRGDQTEEQKHNNGVYRDRATLLGDVVNSNPLYVARDDLGFSVLPSDEGASYSSFAAKTRDPMLYVGSNDGMLHAFDPATGDEKFAYLPNVVISPELVSLSSPTYVHRFFVDGSPQSSDAYYGSAWHTVLIEGMGFGSTTASGTANGVGGRGLFALDITDPKDFDQSKVMWEYTSRTDNDLGYTIPKPSIVRLANGKWGALVANGYNSVNGHAVLIILDIKTGEVIKRIDTGTGSSANPNGLSSPTGVDMNGDAIVDYVYAGDLFGNLWKFDVSANSASDWAVAYEQSNTPVPLFVACASNSNPCPTADRQPITGQPNIGAPGHDQVAAAHDGVMVYFGTGKFYETNDNVVTANPQIQSFYGLWDKHTKAVASDRLNRSELQAQEIDYEGPAIASNDATSSLSVRRTTANKVCYTSVSDDGCNEADVVFKRGWVMNLLKPNSTGEGERVITMPAIRWDLIVFSTMMPTSTACKADGKSWLMEVDALSGKRSTKPPFDIFGVTKNNNTETITATPDNIVDDHDKIKVGNDPLSSASGVSLDIGIHGEATFVSNMEEKVDIKELSGSTTQIKGLVERRPNGASARQSWRQLQ